MTTSEGKEIIDSGWKAAGISDAAKLGSSRLPPIDPFHDIDSMLADESQSINIPVLPWSVFIRPFTKSMNL